MDTLMFTLADEGPILGGIVLVGGMLIAILAITFSFIRGIHSERVRGQTHREIAAYVAEGSITSEEGERLMRAAGEPEKKSCG